MLNSIIEATGWSLEYVMDGISIGALRTLFGPKPKKATGPWAAAQLDSATTEGMKVEKKDKADG